MRDVSLDQEIARTAELFLTQVEKVSQENPDVLPGQHLNMMLTSWVASLHVQNLNLKREIQALKVRIK